MNRLSVVRVTWLLPVLLLAGEVGAQDPEETLTRYRRKYHDQSEVMLHMNTTVRITRENGRIVARRQVEREAISLKAAAGNQDREEVSYSDFVPLEQIEAYTLAPGRKSYRKVEVTEFTHRDERSDEIFHDDNRTVSFLFPAMEPGAIAHLDYTLAYPDARFVTSHFFASGRPVEESTLTVICDPGIEVDALPFHIDDAQLVREEERGKRSTTFRFRMREVPQLDFEPDGPSVLYYAPHLQLMVRDTEDPVAASGSPIDRLYRWYYGHIAGSYNTDDPELRDLALELTRGIDDPHAKAAVLYGWVQDHIRYVAVEDGLNGVIPARPEVTFETRYGDCKGMSNILLTLLRAAGLDAHLAWVGTREKPYRYDELASTAVDDHMIVELTVDTGHVLLDGTSARLPYGMPSAFIQGKQVLVAVDSLNWELVKAPVVPAVRNHYGDSLHLRLEGGDLVGHGRSTYTGYQRSYMANLFEVVPEDRWPDVLKELHLKGSNKMVMDSIRVQGLEDRNVPLVVDYHLRIPDLASRAGGETYVPLELEFPFADRQYRRGRTIPVEFSYCEAADMVVELELPADAEIGHVPEDTHFVGDGFGYRTSHTLEEGRVIMRSTCSVDRLFLDPPAIEEWRSMIDRKQRERNRTLVIQRP